MIILGLTGSIGTGKSAAAEAFAREGAAVFDADMEVHYMLDKGGEVVPQIKKLFPEVVKAGAVDRKELGKIVYGSKTKLQKLEALIHPLVREREEEFLKKCLREKCDLAVLDIPLLFETGADAFYDVTAVVVAPPFIQKQRVMQREGMTAARLKKIISAQLPQHEKIKRADFVIRTGLGRGPMVKQVKNIIHTLEERMVA